MLGLFSSVYLQVNARDEGIIYHHHILVKTHISQHPLHIGDWANFAQDRVFVS